MSVQWVSRPPNIDNHDRYCPRPLCPFREGDETRVASAARLNSSLGVEYSSSGAANIYARLHRPMAKTQQQYEINPDSRKSRDDHNANDITLREKWRSQCPAQSSEGFLDFSPSRVEKVERTKDVLVDYVLPSGKARANWVSVCSKAYM
jgi:hypothetical protein